MLEWVPRRGRLLVHFCHVTSQYGNHPRPPLCVYIRSFMCILCCVGRTLIQVELHPRAFVCAFLHTCALFLPELFSAVVLLWVVVDMGVRLVMGDHSAASECSPCGL